MLGSRVRDGVERHTTTRSQKDEAKSAMNALVQKRGGSHNNEFKFLFVRAGALEERVSWCSPAAVVHERASRKWSVGAAVIPPVASALCEPRACLLAAGHGAAIDGGSRAVAWHVCALQ